MPRTIRLLRTCPTNQTRPELRLLPRGSRAFLQKRRSHGDGVRSPAIHLVTMDWTQSSSTTFHITELRVPCRVNHPLHQMIRPRQGNARYKNRMGFESPPCSGFAPAGRSAPRRWRPALGRPRFHHVYVERLLTLPHCSATPSARPPYLGFGRVPRRSWSAFGGCP